MGHHSVLQGKEDSSFGAEKKVRTPGMQWVGSSFLSLSVPETAVCEAAVPRCHKKARL